MTDPLTLRLGTRGSKLARWQADWVAHELTRAGVHVDLVLISTKGDVTTGPLGEIGGVGLFTKEIQRALLENEIDIAVHSLKDLPTELVNGLTLGAVPARESNQDAFVSNKFSAISDLPNGSVVGTGSNRRRAQLLHVRPELTVTDIRGNVDTRLSKLDDGDYDAIVLAEAGLKRLGLAERITHVLPRESMLPAVGQGALGIEVRADDTLTQDAVAILNDEVTRACVIAERAMLSALRGGCLAPVGAWARVEDDDQIRLDGTVLSNDGQTKVVAGESRQLADAEELGRAVAGQLLDQGAADLIATSRS